MRDANRFDLNRCKEHNARPLTSTPSRRVVQGEGRAAYASKLHLADNPYPTNSTEHRWWEQGHLLAYVDSGMVAA